MKFSLLYVCIGSWTEYSGQMRNSVTKYTFCVTLDSERNTNRRS